jgi:acyl-CoA reductase-like NAD-dependent aldehyde dehydrogenase
VKIYELLEWEENNLRFQTINPATEEVIEEYETMSHDEVFEIANKCQQAFIEWRKLTIAGRCNYVKKLSAVLRNNKQSYGHLITQEMGKPIKESIAEVEKCAWTADVYADSAEQWLADEDVEADGREHKVIYQPLGIILSIMPWNFPFWQALRFAIPTLIAGNVSLLKHSNTVPKCALAIEDSFKEAGFPDNIFRTIIADHDTISDLMSFDLVQGASFTGSTSAGARIAELAGKNLKKIVLELGGADPFVVLEDADIAFAAKNAMRGRTINAGQSCIAAKRFIVVEDVAEQFSKLFAQHMAELVIDDPSSENTDIGPLVNAEALNKLQDQVNDAITKGAKVLAGGNRLDRKGYFYAPTVLSNTTPDMKVVTEEVFAPAAPIIIVKDESEAIKVANSTDFGLGGSVWTKDIERGIRVAKQIESGSVFVNSITKSDPRMPFGGIKKSGIGRELAKFGIKEFVNIKGLNVYEQK